MLKGSKQIRILGEAATGQQGIQIVKDLYPEVVVLDLKLPDISGLEVARQLFQIDPNIKILVLTAVTNDLFPFRLLEMGVLGYISKDCSQNELIAAIKAVAARQRVITPKIANRLALSKINFKSDSMFDSLSEREMEVMLMVICGVSISDIARKLGLSSKTIHSYRSRVFEKLNVKNDVGLTLLMAQKKLLELKEGDAANVSA